MKPFPFGLGFTSLDRETRVDALPVTGTVPPWLKGTLLRNGPAKFEVGGQGLLHWFDGFAMVHRFTFAGGRVAYANRFLQSRAYREALVSGKLTQREFATSPVRSRWQRFIDFLFPQFTDNCSVNILPFGRETVALTETPRALRVDPDSLETLGYFEWRPRLPGHLATAHPHFDFQRRCHYGYRLEFGRRSQYHLYRLAADSGRQGRVATVSAQKPAYVHSFGMTARHLILAEFPLVVDPLQLRLRANPFIENFRWEPERGVRFHVIDKDTGRLITSALSPPCFAFHHVNAFEGDGEILADIVTLPDPGVIQLLYLERLRSGQPVASLGTLTRFHIALDSGKDVWSERLSATPIEFPGIHYRHYAGQPYRYVYGVGNQVPGNFGDALVKLDLKTRQTRSWHQAGCYPGEPVFVAAPTASQEDDGVVLSLVLDTRKQQSFLLLLAAGRYKELARAVLPHPVPFGFHGHYRAAES
ncbi:carotenoid oxygenase family protein [Candidatus Methylocalor cossyra]|uniref:Dioxygenase n=1 Tax=Candidatus Methylocalor cossyra TaxID=3108543 RepID=A0ABM9NML0_9GAMM